MNLKHRQRGHFNINDLWPFVAVIGAVMLGGGGWLLYVAWRMWL